MFLKTHKQLLQTRRKRLLSEEQKNINHTKNGMRIIRIITILSMFYCVPAYASYFEVCLISGEVASSPNLIGKDVFFEILVHSSIATNCKAAESYGPEVCNSYTDQEYEISLPESWRSKVNIGTKLVLIQQKYDDEKGNRYMSLKLPEDCE